MAITVPTTRQQIADFVKGLGGGSTLYVSLHTDDPGTTGANEVTGGTPAYARKGSAFTSGTGGSITGAKVTFDVPAVTVKYAGLWSAATGGTFLMGQPLPSNVTYSAQGQLDVTPSYSQS